MLSNVVVLISFAGTSAKAARNAKFVTDKSRGFVHHIVLLLRVSACLAWLRQQVRLRKSTASHATILPVQPLYCSTGVCKDFSILDCNGCSLLTSPVDLCCGQHDVGLCFRVQTRQMLQAPLAVTENTPGTRYLPLIKLKDHQHTK